MSSETLDCRSHSCYFAVDRTGQRNNGPCRCLPDLSPPVRTQIRMALLAKMNAEREKFARIAETEEELEGEPPAFVVAEMNRVGPVENARAAVRSTKASIARRIRES